MRSDELRAEKIQECIASIVDYISQGEKHFLSDKKTQDAVLRNIQVIGDAVKELSAEFKKKHEHVDWSGWARFRDKITHDYFGIDFGTLWRALQEDLPLLKQAIEEIVPQG
jgi:uncharacterized protein with HEPN domain